MEKKTKIIMITIIVIMILIIAGLTCYIVLDKRNNINSEQTTENKSALDNNEQIVEEIPAKEQARKLTDEELKKFEEYFNDTENNGFLSVEYNKPEEIDINDVLYSNSIAKDLTDEEAKEYSKIMGWGDEPPTQCFKYKKDDINKLLKNKMNISLDDVKIELDYKYIPKYDAYFDIHGDTNHMTVKVISGEINDDGLYIIKYKFGDDEKTVTMKKVDNDYLFVSNLYKSGTIDISKYKGKWYIDENSIGVNASFIEIKGVENNKIKAHGYICRTTEFGDFYMEIEGNTGTFTVKGEQATGALMYGDEAEISGEIKFDNNQVILTIVDTNVDYLEKNYTFSYKSGTKQTIDISKYKGKWYIDENSTEGNASFIEIKGVENNKIKAHGYICRITEFGDFYMEIDGNTGTFTVKGEQVTGALMYGDEAEISGDIRFDNNKIILTIVDTNVDYLEKSYTFSYKG